MLWQRTIAPAAHVGKKQFKAASQEKRVRQSGKVDDV
jgi:hypothetical protein